MPIARKPTGRIGGRSGLPCFGVAGRRGGDRGRGAGLRRRRGQRLKSFVAPGFQAEKSVPDAPPPAGGFTIRRRGIHPGTPAEVAEQIVEQCRPSARATSWPSCIGAPRLTK